MIQETLEAVRRAEREAQTTEKQAAEQAQSLAAQAKADARAQADQKIAQAKAQADREKTVASGDRNSPLIQDCLRLHTRKHRAHQSRNSDRLTGKAKKSRGMSPTVSCRTTEADRKRVRAAKWLSFSLFIVSDYYAPIPEADCGCISAPR